MDVNLNKSIGKRYEDLFSVVGFLDRGTLTTL